MFVAFVKSLKTGESLKVVDPGRPLTKDTTISPFSRGRIREYSVVQITSSSLVIRSCALVPNSSSQSRLE